jgi:hypothetical protein
MEKKSRRERKIMIETEKKEILHFSQTTCKCDKLLFVNLCEKERESERERERERVREREREKERKREREKEREINKIVIVFNFPKKSRPKLREQISRLEI